jgi:hypothetical protein
MTHRYTPNVVNTVGLLGYNRAVRFGKQIYVFSVKCGLAVLDCSDVNKLSWKRLVIRSLANRLTDGFSATRVNDSDVWLLGGSGRQPMLIAKYDRNHSCSITFLTPVRMCI